MHQLHELLKKHAITLTPAFTDQWIKDGAQWFRGKHIEVNGRSVPIAVFGDFSRGLKMHWKGCAGTLTPEEEAELDLYISKTNKENRKAQEAHWEELRGEVEKEWATFSEIGTTPYLEKKGLKKLYGCRVEPFEKGARLIIPARDAGGKLWGYQRIYSGVLRELDTDRLFRSGARKEGCFHLLGTLEGASKIFLCEGISTAASVYEAFDRKLPVLSCFDAGNLVHCAKALRGAGVTAHFVFAADNDCWPSKDGKAHHAGVTYARAAAQAVGNATVVWPVFPEGLSEKRPTDYCDVRRLLSLAEVKKQIEEFKEPEGTATEQVPPAAPAKLTAGQIEELTVQRLLLRYEDREGATLVRQGQDFFVYRKTHWTHLDPLTAPDRFKAEIDQISRGKLKFKDIASAYNRFLIHCPTVPKNVNMFSPNPFAQNFANGTVHLLPAKDGTFEILLRPHRRTDWLIHCHEFDYREDAPLNEEFEASLGRIWAGEEDIEKKKNAYFEVLGACLIPAFRKLVLFVGPPKSGKSTLVLFAVNMVHEQYRCSVDPTQLDGFNLESMAGKLLNYDTDINLVKPIKDSILKKVEDRCPIRIRRKRVSDIYAPIPGMHLLAANRMPISTEGAQAYDRRLLVFRCDKFQPPEAGYIQDYAQHVWKLNCQGIVTRAIQGLKRLAANGGHFTIPESSRREISEWKRSQGDIVQDFLNDISEGEVSDKQTTVMLGAECELERGAMWEIFQKWMDDSVTRQSRIGKKLFYDRLREAGIKEKRTKTGRLFLGVGNPPAPESSI